MQGHLQAFIEILIVHIMDAVHRVDICACQPLHSGVEFGYHIIIVEQVARDRTRLRSYLLA